MSNNDDNKYNPPPLEPPPMAPRGAGLQGRPQRTPDRHRDAVRGDFVDDERGGELERTRPVAARAVAGIGEPQPLAPETILNRSHDLLAAFNAGKEIDPVYVQVMTLQALATFGSHATKISALTNEVARLRKAIFEESEGGSDKGKRSSVRDRIEARFANRRAQNGRDRGGGGRTLLRGRAR